jgi:hypothetical protein
MFVPGAMGGNYADIDVERAGDSFDVEVSEVVLFVCKCGVYVVLCFPIEAGRECADVWERGAH